MKYSNYKMNREMQFFMKELFLVEFVLELILCNIFICCLSTKRETALMDFNEEKILEGSIQCKHK